MKKISKIFILIILILSSDCILNLSFATNQIISQQEDLLGISDFLEQSEDASDNFFKTTELNEVFENLITGKIKISEIFTKIKERLQNEFMSMLEIMLTIIILVIIHSVFKIITENLNNESVGKIAYFIQYILIVIFTMKIYSESIEYIKTSIDSLIDYTYMFIPILMTLAISTGNVTTVRDNRAYNFICNYFYRKSHNIHNYSIFINWYSLFNNFKYIR